MTKVVKPTELDRWSGRCVDVRNPDEFLSERLARAELVPLDQLAKQVEGWQRQQPVLLICRSGMRASQGAQQLETLGFTDVAIVEGGLEACKRAGVGIIRDSKRIPLFRQILIGAGLFLLVTLALSLYLPWFIGMTWLIAGMLVIAGLTGFCPMQYLLQRMPWNRAGTAHQSGGPSCACSAK